MANTNISTQLNRISGEVTSQTSLISQIATVLESKGGTINGSGQTPTGTPLENNTTSLQAILAQVNALPNAGSSGGKITVTTSVGASVVASMGATQYSKVADSEGLTVFDGLADGTWTVVVSDNGGTAVEQVEISADVYLLPVFKPIASTTATSGVTYADGLSGLDAETVSLFGEAISNNSAITNTTSTVYIDFDSAHRKIDIGDQVTLALNGTNYTFDVIGFNHDTLTTAAAYGANTATGKAGMTLQMHDLFATTYAMNNSNTNSGGWKNSAMRTSTMATMKGYLPDDWEAIIKPVNKASGTGGGSSSGTETVSDSCFLLAEIEIFGRATDSVSGEGTQYAYYKAGNSKVKNKSGSANIWWERSPRSGSSDGFCRVNTSGGATGGDAVGSRGVAFGFCV